MLVIDTNVLSEVMRPVVEPAVADYLRTLPIEQLATTAITRAEILYGIALMPPGRRRRERERAARALLDETLGGRILPFDTDAAEEYAGIRSRRDQMGRPTSSADAMIAAICRAHGATIVTRDEDSFAGCGVPVINPWHRR